MSEPSFADRLGEKSSAVRGGDAVGKLCRVKRRPFNLLAGVSLVLCLAACTKWWCSHGIILGDQPSSDGKGYVLVTDFTGFLWSQTTTTPAVHYWAITILTGACPTFVADRYLRRRLLRMRRIRNSCCQNCGYDLRATPDRCPECGTVTPKQTS